MKSTSFIFINQLLQRRPVLSVCETAIIDACEAIIACYNRKGKLLACGNGGSAADAGHIVGELMKSFLLKRPVSPYFKDILINLYSDGGEELANQLQGALPAISLSEHAALVTAVANDISASMVYAQQVYGYGCKGDVLLAISTSGYAANVVNAVKIAHGMDICTLCLTGQSGGTLRYLCDIAICVPASSTAEVQELHLPVYHTLCAVIENELFKGDQNDQR